MVYPNYTPLYKTNLPSSAYHIHMTQPLKVLINAVVANDWELTSGAGAKDSVEDLERCIPNKDGTVKIVLRIPSPGINLSNIFPILKPESASFAALVIMAHTAPVNPAAKPDPKNRSGQLLSLSAKGALAFVPFERVAAAIKKTTKHARYDLVLLACCQGDKLFPLFPSAVKPDGVVMYFGGPDESPTDGVHLFLAQDMVEKTLELIHVRLTAGDPLNSVELFRLVYTELGREYMGPSDLRRLDKDLNGEYLYAKYMLTCSSESALKLPDYVKDYMLAGRLQGCAMGVGALVDDTLKAKRAEFMEQAQRDVDREHDHAGPAKPSAPSI